MPVDHGHSMNFFKFISIFTQWTLNISKWIAETEERRDTKPVTQKGNTRQHIHGYRNTDSVSASEQNDYKFCINSRTHSHQPVPFTQSTHSAVFVTRAIRIIILQTVAQLFMGRDCETHTIERR